MNEVATNFIQVNFEHFKQKANYWSLKTQIYKDAVVNLNYREEQLKIVIITKKYLIFSDRINQMNYVLKNKPYALIEIKNCYKELIKQKAKDDQVELAGNTDQHLY